MLSIRCGRASLGARRWVGLAFVLLGVNACGSSLPVTSSEGSRPATSSREYRVSDSKRATLAVVDRILALSPGKKDPIETRVGICSDNLNDVHAKGDVYFHVEFSFTDEKPKAFFDRLTSELRTAGLIVRLSHFGPDKELQAHSAKGEQIVIGAMEDVRTYNLRAQTACLPSYADLK